MLVVSKKNIVFILSLVPALCLLTACKHDAKWMAPGTVEWDRVAVLAEVSEPVLSIEVNEGDAVEAGQLLLRLDSRRTQLELDAAKAQLAQARSNVASTSREQKRASTLHDAKTISQQAYDNADTAKSIAMANLANAQANVDRMQLTLQRLEVRAPRAGRIDSLPYRKGDQPPPGVALVSLLVGDEPYARVYIPEPWRAGLQVGQKLIVKVDGIEKPFDAVLRSIRSEPSFTPYYALSGDDASRLSYRAELTLKGDVSKLPPGIPCHAEPIADDNH